MPGIDVPPAMMANIKEAMTSTSEKIIRFSQGNCLEDVAIVRELYEVLRTATWRVANLLNEAAPTHRLPPEILTRILYLAVDHGSEEHPGQVIPLTHVCRYWRTLLLSYPKIWSTLCMRPGNPSVISQWLSRSQSVPLTVVAEFYDADDHPPCRYTDSATATLDHSTLDLDVCPRHEAVLSLDQLLPHRSRICDLNILVHSSDPYWDEDGHSGEPTLLYHPFFRESLPNLQRLCFRASHVEQSRFVTPVPDLLFAGELPHLEELRYLGVTGGLTETAKNLVSCEIGFWLGSAGPTFIAPEELQTLFDNNKTVRSLTIIECEFTDGGPWAPSATPMINLNRLDIRCPMDDSLEKILSCIHAPQFKDLDTVKLLIHPPCILTVATDASGRTFQFSQYTDNTNFHPLRHLGANITTLRLAREMTVQRFDEGPQLYESFRTLDAVQVLEFDGAATSVKIVLSNITGLFPGLKVIRVAVSQDDCEDALQLLAIVLMLRMGEGNPLSAIEPLSADGEGVLCQEVREEWEKHYEAAGIQKLLSK